MTKMRIPFIKQILTLVLILLPVLSHAQEYKVGEGDILEINVYENKDLSTAVRVSSTGTIRVPLLGEITVNDLTVSQVAARIERFYSNGYLVDPQVDVFISEHRSKKAIILGQIKNPGQYELRGKVSFLEFISKAGGLTPEAGSIATIKHSPGKGNKNELITINLEELIKKGDTHLNIPIQDNDSIYISKAETYYVSGEVNKPDSYKYEPELTVIKAVTMAGGFSKIAAKNKVKIIRTINGRETIFTHIKMDEPILPDDIIVVPESFF